MKKLMTAVAIAAVLASCGGGQQGRPNFGDNEYVVSTVGGSNADLKSTYPAIFKGVQDVEIRPKVSGFITKIYVKEGQAVSAGQVLFSIDSQTYQAAVNQAKAAVASAQTAVNTAQLSYENSEKLFASNVIGDFELQTAKNQYESAKAALVQNQAALASAQESLSWCTIKAPTSGLVGSLPYKVGTLVSASNALTIISNGSSVDVYFSVSEKEVLNLTREHGSLQAGINNYPAVKLQLADGTEYESEGKIIKASGVIDPTTGTTSLIASFPNPKHILKSGGSGTIIMPYQATDAIIIPQEATVDIQNKHFVYIVGKDNKVKQIEVTVDPQNDGQNYIITSGLKKGDRFVSAGVNGLQEGTEIKPITEAEYKQKLKKAAELGKVQGDGVIAVGKALQS